MCETATDKETGISYLKESFGCEKPTETAATWFEENEEWYNCPIKFIPLQCREFIEKYDWYTKKFATPPDYEKQSYKFIQAVREFETRLNEFMLKKQGK